MKYDYLLYVDYQNGKGENLYMWFTSMKNAIEQGEYLKKQFVDLTYSIIALRK